MLGKATEVLPVTLFNAYQKQLEHIAHWKKREPGVELIYVDCKSILSDAETTLSKINEFIVVVLNKEEMIKCIDTSLYRNKSQRK